MFSERLKITLHKTIKFLKVFVLYLLLLSFIVFGMLWVDKNIPESTLAKINDNAINTLLFGLVLILAIVIVSQIYRFVKWLIIEPLIKNKELK